MVELHTIRTSSGKRIPDNTLLKVSVGTMQNSVRVYSRFPGQLEFMDLGELPIIDGTVVLPFRLVFLSYAREDEVKVSEIARLLTNTGLLTWFDKNELLPGDRWQRRIEEAIDHSDYVLAFLSRASIAKRGYVQRELRLALRKSEEISFDRRFVIPVLLEDCSPPPELGEIHWLKYWEPDAKDKLIAALRS